MAAAVQELDRRLRLALSVPDDGAPAESLFLDARTAGTQKYGWIARSGGGKSYGAGKLAELLFGAGVPLIVLDPVGNWYGLRLGADGKSPGLEIPVIGGPRGDLPLDLDRAAALAEWLVQHDGSAVIDLSELRKNERKRFVAAFAESLFHAAKSHRRPRMVVIEEAQVFAPQMSKGSEQMLGAIEDLVRLGRNYGIGSMLISQRPQSVNKEVLNQVECLFVGQLQGAHERKAIGDWCAGKQQLMPAAALASLQPGTFFCWSPQWLQWFGKVRILSKSTFDGSSTPDLDDVDLAPGHINKMELEALRLVLSKAPPAGAAKGKGVLGLALPEPPRVDEAELAAAADELMRVSRARDDANEDLRVVRGKVEALLQTLVHLIGRVVADVDGNFASMMLAALGGAGHLLSRVELAIRVGVVHSGGFYRSQLRALVEAGLVTTIDSGNLMLTEAGKERAQRSTFAPPRGKALVATWMQRLKGAAPGILQALIAHRQGLTSDELAAACGGKAATGGYFRKGLKQVRGAGLVVGDAGRWQLSDEAKHLGR